MNSSFLDQLPLVEHFDALFNENQGALIPSDWLIVATDVMGSTKAIEAGRYKEVNTLGAASITHLVNACKPQRIAYQFGGDGALCAIPPECCEVALKALAHLALVAETDFGLRLRIGVWSVGAFTDQGYEFYLTKYQLASEQALFMFHGTGVNVSDDWLKDKSPVASLSLPPVEVPDSRFSAGLECRWNPLKSKNGVMLSGIIAVSDQGGRGALLSELHQMIVADDDQRTRPVSLESLTPAFPPKDYLSEWRIRTAGHAWWRRALTFVSVHLKIALLLPIVVLLKEKIPYLQELIERSDFQKYDGVYRFVRDVSPEHVNKIREWCEDKHRQGLLCFGLSTSPTALMTCVLFDGNEHIHFIDGGNGGYAMAAKTLKSQLKGIYKSYG